MTDDEIYEVRCAIDSATIELLDGISNLRRSRAILDRCKRTVDGRFTPAELSAAYRAPLDWFMLETGMSLDDFVSMLPDEDETKHLFDRFLQTREFTFVGRTNV